MQLVEQGKLSLDAPIGKVLPDLASPQVLEGFDANGEPMLRPARNPITLRHLMTHTAGFCYNMWNGDMVQYLEKTGLPAITTCKNDALKLPLMTDPGTRWEYGINIDYVGKAVEAVSGKRLDAYLRDHLFSPLGMTDTAFKIGDAQRKRLVAMHGRGPDGSLAPIPFELEQDPEFHMGGGGLYGTAGDYIKFTQMILNKGKRQRQPGAEARDGRADGPEPHRRTHHDQDDLGGRRSPPTMSTSIPDMVKKWGLALPDQRPPQTAEGRSPGSLAWAGLANTYYWIDPGARCHRRDPDAGAAVRGRQVPGSLRGLRVRRLCRARRDRPKGGLDVVHPSVSGAGVRPRSGAGKLPSTGSCCGHNDPIPRHARLDAWRNHLD